MTCFWSKHHSISFFSRTLSRVGVVVWCCRSYSLSVFSHPYFLPFLIVICIKKKGGVSNYWICSDFRNWTTFSCSPFSPLSYLFRDLLGMLCCISCIGFVYLRQDPAVGVTDRCKNAALVIFKYSAGEQYHDISGSHWYCSLIFGCLSLLC